MTVVQSFFSLFKALASPAQAPSSSVHIPARCARPPAVLGTGRGQGGRLLAAAP